MAYTSSLHEPLLDELFADPIIQLLMQKDGVAVDDLHPMLDWLAREIAVKSTHSPLIA